MLGEDYSKLYLEEIAIVKKLYVLISPISFNLGGITYLEPFPVSIMELFCENR